MTFRQRILAALVAAMLLALVACGGDAEPSAGSTPAPTAAVAPTADLPVDPDSDLLVIATDAPLPPFADFDPFGNVVGFNNAVVENIASRAGLEYEFVVTPSEGVLDNIASGSARDFDAVMSALIIPETPPPGIAFTHPYLDVGQVIVVLVDEQEIKGPGDIQPGMTVGVLADSAGEDVARALGIAESDLFATYDKPSQLIQALIDEVVDVVIIDSYAAEYFAAHFPEQVRVAGGEGREAWLDARTYGIAVAADNTDLLDTLNEAIDAMQAESVFDQLTIDWLITEADPAAAVNPGESRVGTPATELFIGVVGQFSDMDPASLTTDFIGWEIKTNTMSGLYRFNPDNALEPLLAGALPAISEDKLEYTIPLRTGLRFPDGSEFTADDVKWSLNRAAGLGNFLVNTYLKDSNDDNFADEDAVQVIDQATVKIILQEPTAYFPALLATPPFFPISSECYTETGDPGSTCGAIGPYTVVSWSLNDRMRLRANPDWPGEPKPAFENITIKFHPDAGSMRRSLTEFRSTDLAWTGLTFQDYVDLTGVDADGDGQGDYTGWEGPSTFKSYIIFEQSAEPWDSERVRQAAAYAIDREGLATVFGGARLPLLSPVPNDIPGHVETFPARDLDRARELLRAEGYTEAEKLVFTLRYVNDGRYSPVEEAYANAIKAQLEETGVFQVELGGVGWDEMRLQISQCGFPAYLIGWPSPGQPVSYLDVSSWTDFFVTNTSRVFCSNYESEEMTELVAEARAELEEGPRQVLNGQIQTLWAEELPTLPLTQEPRRAVSLTTIDGVRVDALGMMHYEWLTKDAE
jgi:peptide/nickel transport system substrate-binding protein